VAYRVENRKQDTEIAVLFGPRGFRSETSFQKNRQRPPGLAVGNNTSTKYRALPLCGGLFIRGPVLVQLRPSATMLRLANNGKAEEHGRVVQATAR
jgi:hypothetical protein